MATERRDKKKRVLLPGEYQKPDGRYMYRYTANGKTNFVYSWTLTATDKTPKGKKNGKCLRVLEHEINMSIAADIDFRVISKKTVNRSFDEYVASRTDFRPTTQWNYQLLYDKHIRNTLGNRRITDVRYSELVKYYRELMSEKHLAPSTVASINSILKAIFQAAVHDGYIRLDPTDKSMTEAFRLERKSTYSKRLALTREQQSAFLNFVSNSPLYKRWEPLMIFLLGTGCRISEALGLRWEDCDFEKDTISINHILLYKGSAKDPHYTFKISETKTDAGNRTIPMFPKVKEALLAERERHEIDGYTISVVDGYYNFVFRGRTLNVMTVSQVDGAILEMIKKYNLAEQVAADEEGRKPILLPKFSSHNLRHTFGTRLYEATKDAKMVQGIMGHARVNTTLDTYIDLSEDFKKESFADIEKRVIC